MKAGNILAAAVIAGGIYFFIKTKKAQVKKQTGFAKFEIKKVGLKGLNVVVKIGILNPSNLSMKFNSFVGGLLVQGKEIAKAKSFKPVTIKPAAETDIEITFVPSGIGVLTALRTIFQKKLGNMEMILKGAANFNGSTLPVNLKF